MAKEKIWYSTIYEEHNYGFYISKFKNKEYLGFKPKKGNTIEVKISKPCFDVLKKEWK